MKTVLAIAVAASFAASAYAQLSTVPGTEGLNIHSPGDITYTQTQWASSQLGDYYFATDNNLGTPNMGHPDNVDGLSWQHTVNGNVTSILNTINGTVGGGTIRAIFVGESAGWHNDFGYSYNGNPTSSSSYSLFNNIQAAGGSPNIWSGTYADISLAQGKANAFDFWLNGVGQSGNYGGVYTPINQANSAPYIAPGNVLWASSAIQVPTWIASKDEFENVTTYLVGFEDWRLNEGADKDYNDFMFAIQLFDKNGNPFSSPVPEPSTYGLIGAAALLGLVARRRFASKK